MKKGFTLIELLAVIVILAIIALIVTPVVSNIILNARIAANARSVEGHVRNVELAIMSRAYKDDTGDLTNFDVENGDLSNELTLPNNDDITCDSYTIRNGAVVNAYGCKSSKANWNKVYKYTNDEGASVSGENDVVVATAGLFDDSGNLIKSWDELVSLGLDVSQDYSSSTYSTSSSSGYSVFRNNNLVGNLIIPSSVTKIGNMAFYAVNGLKKVQLKNGISTIGYSAFQNSSITSIEIPSSVTSLGNGVFSGCTSLTSMKFNASITTLPAGTFQNCTNLTSVTLPSTITTIASASFQRSGITSLTLPDSVTSIEFNAFMESNLETVVIGSGVNMIKTGAFYNSNNVTSVTFKDSTGWYVTTNPNATSGTSIDVSNATTNASNFTGAYIGYYWKKA